MGSKWWCFMKTRLLCCFLGQGMDLSPCKWYLSPQVSVAQLCSPWLVGLVGQGLPDWGCAVYTGTGGTALQGMGWVAKAGVFPACVYVSALGV